VTYPGLAAAVAARLAPAAPVELRFREEPPGYLRAEIDESRWEVFPLDEPEVEAEIDPEVYDPPYPAFAVLEALDFVVELARYELDEQLPEPWAELAGNAIRAGFGDQELAPIPLSGLSST
jgi:hypothetical protein